jgi:hypothetical protein
MNEASAKEFLWLAPGVTVPAVTQLVAQAIVMPFMGSLVKRLSLKGMWLTSFMGVLGPLSIGISASTGVVWIQYLGAVLAAPAFVLGLEYEKVVVIQWWALDRKQRIGTSIQGGMVGAQTVLFSLVMGWSCYRFGLAPTAYFMAALFAMFSLYPLRLALSGELGPPSAELVHTAAGIRQPQGAMAGLTRCQLFCSLTFWQMFLHNFIVPFTGFGMKLLLTSVFQVAYDTPFLASAKLATLSLVFFGVARVVFTLLVKSGHLMIIMTAMVLFNASLYASSPAIISNLPIWWLLASKTMAGVCFAGLLCMSPLLLLQAYTPSDLPVVFNAIGPARGLGFALGPLVGYYVHVVSRWNGVAHRDTYNPFFYTSAALSVVAGLNMALLHARLSHRPVQKPPKVPE